MQNQTSIGVLGLALLLAVPANAQTQAGTIRVHVTVPGTQAPIPGVQLSLVAPQNTSTTLDLPDNESAAAVALTVNAAGGATVKTVVLLTPEEVDAAGKRSVDYRPPGG